MRGCCLVTGWSANMQSLVVHALAMRQLGRLNPRHLLAAGYSLRPTEWSPRSIHTRQLWGCAVPTVHGGHGPAVRARDGSRSWSLHHLRLKSTKKRASTAARDEDGDEEENEPEDSDYEDEDPNLPKDYKDVEKSVQSFRSDLILKAGLDISRSKIEEAFYKNKLRLNGLQLIKKSKAVRVGDTLDLVLSENPATNTVTLMRVILRRVLGESSNPERSKVSLRRWKNLELPKNEAFKA